MRWEAVVALALLAGPAAPSAASYVPDPGEADPAGAEVDREQANQPGHPYHTWETLTVELQQLVQSHPDVARLHSGGESVLGLDLWVVEIANFRDADKTPLDERETIWLDGGTHANEQLGTEFAFDWIEFLLTGYGDNETATWIVDNRHTFVMPMVNPDGNHQDSRWNARTVNINRNYPSGWRATDENPVFNDPGPYPASEPETRAVIEWWEATEPDYVNSFHTGFEGMLYPWGYPDEPTPDAQVYRRICEEVDEPDREFCGPVAGIVGPTGGGSLDTAYKRTGAVSFAYELSSEGFLYASVEDPRTRLQRFWTGIEHAFLNVERYGAHPAIENVTLDGDRVRLAIANDGYGNLTQGHVTLHVPGTDDVVLETPPVPAGGSASLAVQLPTGAADDGRLEAELVYLERRVGGSTETVTRPLPVAVEDDELVEAPLAGNAAGEALAVQSTDDERLGVPAPGAALVALALAAVAALRRR